MAGRRGSNMDNNNTLLLQNKRLFSSSSSSSQPLDSLFISGSSPSFLGLGSRSRSRSMVSFEDVNGGNKSGRSFFCSFDQEENGDDELDEYFHQHEKKRRLTIDQVQSLEKNFEVENKLEPERKIQLAKDLNLQPRQVAIWFQNRRARWKTKQLEKDYDTLQASYNSLKGDCDSLLKEKEKLKAEVLYLTDKLLKKSASENSNSTDTDELSKAPAPEPNSDSFSEGEVSKVTIVPCKQEDLAAKSDVVDSESPHYIDGSHSSFVEPGDCSYIFEPDQSDLSQEDEDDILSKCFMPHSLYGFSKIEDAEYSDLPANSCLFGFQDEDHAFGFWSN